MGSYQHFDTTKFGEQPPGKIEASLNQKLQGVKWGEYELQELFYITGTKSLDSNAIEFTETGINFVGRTFENNGIQGKIQKRDFEPNKPYTITATVIGNYKYVKYQKEEYYCSQNINKLSPKSIFERWNEKIAYFLIANIQRFVSLYDGQQGGYKLEDIKRHKIKLPTQNGKIDFGFMESFIARLEEQFVAELEAYLSITGLNDYELTDEEEKAINDYLDKKIVFETYTLGDLFNIERTSGFNADKLVSGNEYDYVTRTSTNQGVLQTTGFVNEENINAPGVWSLGLLQMDFFYRKNPWYAGQFIRKIIPKNNISFFAAMYLTTILNKQKPKLLSVLVRDVDKTFQGIKVKIPTINSKINFPLIDTLISAVQKLVIKDVVLYSNKKLNATKDSEI